MLALMDLETSGITKQNNIEISRRCSQNTRIVARPPPETSKLLRQGAVSL
jgi:hypothetical protein